MVAETSAAILRRYSIAESAGSISIFKGSTLMNGPQTSFSSGRVRSVTGLPMVNRRFPE